MNVVLRSRSASLFYAAAVETCISSLGPLISIEDPRANFTAASMGGTRAAVIVLRSSPKPSPIQGGVFGALKPTQKSLMA